jgi:hypothetical protein
MNAQRSLSGPPVATVVGLVVGALGIAILWASGVEFPIYPPPGIVILLAGAIFVGLAWWAPAVGAFMGLFVTVGFVVSGGPPNLVGRDGTSVAIGTWIQMMGVLTALIAGVIATRANYRREPTCGLPSNDLASSWRHMVAQPGHAMAVNVDTPPSSTTFRRAPRAPWASRLITASRPGTGPRSGGALARCGDDR